MENNEQSRAGINARLERTNIKGKEYVTVNQRVQGFWEMFPEGSISTTWLALERDYCVCQATICNMGVVVATGTAQEERTKVGVNSTSFIENCETSAVGRALGIFGIGSVESIASADETEQAIAKQDAKAKPKTPAKTPAEPSVMATEAPSSPKPPRTLGSAYKACKDAGISDEELSGVLALHFPGKTTKDLDVNERKAAIVLFENLLAQVQ